jgi:carboxylate-amine ligase
VITLGVEEEYLLLDPASGLPVPLADEVRAGADLESAVNPGEVQPELLQVQVEVATPVCRDLKEVGGHLSRMRHALSAAAEKAGCRIAACGAAPFTPAVPIPVTNSPRYRAMLIDAAQLVDEQLIAGMHVHVAVPDRATAVAVLSRLRPWLPVLVAMSANSPLWHGSDTGFASWRTVVFDRWPVSGPPPLFRDAADYEHRVQALLTSGVIRDRGQLYWQARVCEHYPTVEVRAMDVQLRADDAVMLAGIARALVATVIREERMGLPFPTPSPEFLAAANWYAARHGTADMLVDPLTAQPRKAGDVVSLLMAYLEPGLQESGDAGQVLALARRLLQEGTAADKQRHALQSRGANALVDMLTAWSAAPAS